MASSRIWFQIVMGLLHGNISLTYITLWELRDPWAPLSIHRRMDKRKGLTKSLRHIWGRIAIMNRTIGQKCFLRLSTVIIIPHSAKQKFRCFKPTADTHEERIGWQRYRLKVRHRNCLLLIWMEYMNNYQRIWWRLENRWETITTRG